MADLEERQREFATHYKLIFEEYKKLATATTTEELITCLELLKASSHRSAFRHEMAEQIRTWLAIDSIHKKPMSAKQFAMTKPRWPVHVYLPT